MARKKTQGTRLNVFGGREASLNRVIFKILEKTSPLIAYDIWLQLRAAKGYKHTDTKTVYRRVQALEMQGWITNKGSRPAKPGWGSTLYGLTLRGTAALRLDEKSIEEFLQTATPEQLVKFIDTFSQLQKK